MNLIRPAGEKLADMEVAIRNEFFVDVVVIQNGCFYETFGDSATITSSIFGYEIFQRMGSQEVCGFPPNRLEKWICDLEDLGHKVAVVEQIQSASSKTMRELRYISENPELNFHNLSLTYLLDK